MTIPPKTPSTQFSAANLCCLAGLGLVLYGSFLFHPCLGYWATGIGLIAFGVLLKRG